MLRYVPLKSSQIEELREKIIELSIKYKLLYTFSIPYRALINPVMTAYLEAFSTEAPFDIVECDRYQGDNHKGLKVTAKRDIPRNTILKCIVGFYQNLDFETKVYLDKEKLDFSVMKSSRKNLDMLLLGPVAFINHDCNANSCYISLSRNFVKIKTIRKIQAGEEILCNYSSNYFGAENKYCECVTCQENGKGYFMKKNSIKITSQNKDDDIQPSNIISNNFSEMSSEQVLKLNLNTISIHSSYIALSVSRIFSKNILSSIRLQVCQTLSNYFSTDQFIFKSSQSGTDIVIVINKLYLKFEIEQLYWLESIIKNYLKTDKPNFHDFIQCCVENDISIQLNLKSLLNPYSIGFSSVCLSPHMEYTIMFDFEEEFCGFSMYKKLDQKIDRAYIKLEKLHPLVIKRYQKKSKDGNTFCIFCQKFVKKFSRHLSNKHIDNDVVKMFLIENENKSSKRLAINFIRNQGLAKYKDITGTIMPAMKIRVDALNPVQKVQCDNCFGFFSRATMWKHKLYCRKLLLSEIRSTQP
ncbi:uncharacterized protein LOC131669791 isoform X2 [Phymastichus coffea]|nr:uncharacterized protein LOC131669587 isoform X2 [Phymastichus coffea]XP_058800920.1 uncharacterized protein LOC131669791 isoform X2 [Phymastichus coffea]XP_058800928.1 uncharacterized protein LOC131669791 isoform X2 [Phymastichus coffea]XP_058800937.1 uncharacterized protein LOC131669791 isoform X2 [Phymastichus coffea]XP_058800945.1 uncharacterized protein LOC131669791 isoform X2 [Phymastichus coffea]